MYEQGDGVERDLAEACRLYGSAAAKGHEHAKAGFSDLRNVLVRTLGLTDPRVPRRPDVAVGRRHPRPAGYYYYLNNNI